MRCPGSCKSCQKKCKCYQVFADFRCDKETQVTELHYLSREVVIKIEQDGKEIRLLGNYPTASSVHHYIRKAIDAKMCIKRWAKSSAIGANVSVERYARKPTGEHVLLFVRQRQGQQLLPHRAGCSGGVAHIAIQDQALLLL